MGNWPAKPFTVIDKTPVIREKPYLFIDHGGRYFVTLPSLAHRRGGPDVGQGNNARHALPIERFYLATRKRQCREHQCGVAEGKNLLLTPGVYSLEDGIRITRPGTVLLGLGFPHARAAPGNPAVVISDVDGVTVGGLMIDAGTPSSATLLQVGEAGDRTSHAKAPTFLYDIVCRAGGASAGSVDCMVAIHSNDVVGDNLWLWRADHGAGATGTSIRTKADWS